MKVNEWFQKYVSGQANTPQKIVKAARDAETIFDNDTLYLRFLKELSDAEGWAAIDRLKKPPHFFTSEMHLKQHDRAVWGYTNPDRPELITAKARPEIELFAAHLVEHLRKIGVPMFVHSAVRSMTEQNEAWMRGNSRAKWPRAPHCQGAAVDVVHATFGWALTRGEWAMIGKLGKIVADKLGLQVEWGGDFKSLYDPAHWQLSDWDAEIKHLPTMGIPVRKTPRAILRANKGQPTKKQKAPKSPDSPSYGR